MMTRMRRLADAIDWRGPGERRGDKSTQQWETPLDLNGQTVLVTGGAGSFGRSFVLETLARFEPKRLIIYSRDEFKHFEMAQTFGLDRYPGIRYFIGDIRDRDRLELALRGVDIVVHAAALKQVAVAEYNPFECVATNVVGAENLVHASIRTGVKRVLALSTDKAANPVNLYGATKLAADRIFSAANNVSAPTGTVFSVVRYGNVMGSRGSVIPLFRKLIAEGADSLPITDTRMTRFWLTLPQGARFVLSCLGMMRGGEVFVPKIPSMKISDMARVIAPALGQHVIGIKPGEKIHETMVTEYDSRTTVDLGDRYVIEPAFTYWDRRSFRDDGASAVPDSFVYSSDTNTEWLDDTAVARLLEEI